MTPGADASRLERALRPLHEFLRMESSGGITLMFGAVLAMLVANSPLHGLYRGALDIPLTMKLGDFGISKPLLLWVNDGLMAVFFFLVGMELKREVVDGHLSSLRTAALPGFAALGGMAVPALIYAALNRGNAEALQGWAIPSATDIAFALGVLSLLGDRVPAALKAFLLSVAIFDDLGAIVVIAIFYTAKLSTAALVTAAVLIAGLAVLNRRGVTRPAAYVLLGIPLWVAVLKSGVHATLAGVVLAMFIPLRAKAPTGEEGHDESLLRRLEHALHPWVAFGILPLFAFANAGIPLAGLSPADLLRPVPLGIAAGLFAGKQIGIVLFCLAAVASRVASLPDGVRWSHIHAASLLCGIGFTMSLFIASLAFEAGGFQGLERLGILAGSLLSGAAGFLAVKRALGSPSPA